MVTVQANLQSEQLADESLDGIISDSKISNYNKRSYLLFVLKHEILYHGILVNGGIADSCP